MIPLFSKLSFLTLFITGAIHVVIISSFYILPILLILFCLILFAGCEPCLTPPVIVYDTVYSIIHDTVVDRSSIDKLTFRIDSIVKAGPDTVFVGTGSILIKANHTLDSMDITIERNGIILFDW